MCHIWHTCLLSEIEPSCVTDISDTTVFHKMDTYIPRMDGLGGGSIWSLRIKSINFVRWIARTSWSRKVCNHIIWQHMFHCYPLPLLITFNGVEDNNEGSTSAGLMTVTKRCNHIILSSHGGLLDVSDSDSAFS